MFQAINKPAHSSLRSTTGAALATVVMNDTNLAVKLISEVSFAEELIAKLSAYPGALERIALADSSPKWVKSMAVEALDEAGYVILT